MRNKYSLVLLGIMMLLLLVGCLALFFLEFIGVIPLVLGVFMLRGFKVISAGDPRKAGLITFLGKRQDDTPVEGLVLLLDYLPIEIVGVIEFEMRKEDREIPIESIRCADNIRMGGKVSISMSPDIKFLGKFDDAGKMNGVFKQVDDQIITGLQEIARKNNHEWMEDNTLAIGHQLMERINKFTYNARKRNDPHIEERDLADMCGLGIEINKLQVKLKPNSPEIIKASESRVLEELDRKGQEYDTETINKQVRVRYEMYLEQWILDNSSGQIPTTPRPTLENCRKEIFDERLDKHDKYTKMVNEGGVNVNQKKI